MSDRTKQYVWIGIILVIIVGGFVWNRVLTSDPDIVARGGIHWHSDIAIYIDGVRHTIPDNVGIPAGVSHPANLHTHAGEPNVVHMEFEGIVREKQTRIGDFFQLWGENFSSTSLLGYTAENGKTIRMMVNGRSNTDFENYIMKDHDRIEIRYE